MKTDLEKTYNCIDRGKVSAFSVDGASRWIECCARCHAVAHIIIMKTGERLKACPRCLVVLDEVDRAPQRREKKFDIKNRITKYMEE